MDSIAGLDQIFSVLRSCIERNTEMILQNCISPLIETKRYLSLLTSSGGDQSAGAMKLATLLQMVSSKPDFKIGIDNYHESLQIWPILLYISTVVFCLGSSTIFHLFHPKNPQLMKILNRIDLAGISFLIYGSSIAMIYYAFYCQQIYFWLYFTVLGLVSSFVFGVSMQDWVYHKSKAAFRGNMYVALGIFSGFSFLHVLVES